LVGEQWTRGRSQGFDGGANNPWNDVKRVIGDRKNHTTKKNKKKKKHTAESLQQKAQVTLRRPDGKGGLQSVGACGSKKENQVRNMIERGGKTGGQTGHLAQGVGGGEKLEE